MKNFTPFPLHLVQLAQGVAIALLTLAVSKGLASAVPNAYLYDELHRLTQVTYADGRQVSFAYDDMGNLTSVQTKTRSAAIALVGVPLAGSVGSDITDYQIETNRPTEVTGYKVTKLPSGLKVNTKMTVNKDGKDPGIIYGTPKKEGAYSALVSIKTVAGFGPAVPLAINISNPFTETDRGFSLAGAISGEIAPSAIVGGELGGWLGVKTSKTGTFSGKLELGRARHSFKGAFDANTGAAAPITITRKGLSDLTLTLTLIMDGPDRGRVTGTLGDGTTTDALAIQREVWSKTLPATAFAVKKKTRYNVINSTDAANTTDDYPQGIGYATILIDLKGKSRLSGKLQDGTTFTQARVIWSDGKLPLHVALYRKTGVINGQMQIDTGTDLSPDDNSISGNAWWQRPASAKATDRLFAAGFTTDVDLMGGVYLPPARGERVLELGPDFAHAATELEFMRGGLAAPITSAITLSTRNKVDTIVPNNNSIALRFTTRTGLVKGTFKVDARKATFLGIILPSSTANPSEAYGYFLLPGSLKTDPILSGSGYIGPP